MEKNILMQAENLQVVYPNFQLRGVSFCLEAGKIVGLIGENGAGKTTTIKAIMGMVPLSLGEVRVLGILMNRDNVPELRQKIGYVGGPMFAYHKIKIEKILKFLSVVYDNWDMKLAKNFLSEFNIDEKKKVMELSSGMRVKLQIVIALCHGADVLIMDEPTSGIDPVTRNEILKILGDAAHEEGKAVLFSSHITSDLDKIADCAIFVKDGEVKREVSLPLLESQNLDAMLMEISGRCVL